MPQVLERFARLIRASGVVPSVGRLATTQLYSSIKTYAKGLSVQGSRLAGGFWCIWEGLLLVDTLSMLLPRAGLSTNAEGVAVIS